MAKVTFWLTGLLLGISACQPVVIEKKYVEHYWDQQTGKEIWYSEQITQQPESRMPMHLKHAEL